MKSIDNNRGRFFLFIFPIFMNCVGLPFVAHNPSTIAEGDIEYSVSTSGNWARYQDRNPYYVFEQVQPNGKVQYRNAVQFQDIFFTASRGFGDGIEAKFHVYALFQDTLDVSGIPWFGGSIKKSLKWHWINSALFLDAAAPVPWCAAGAHSGGCGINLAFNPGFSIGTDFLYAGISYAFIQGYKTRSRNTIHMPVLLIGTKIGEQFALNIEVSSFRNNLMDLVYDQNNNLIPYTNGAFGLDNIVLSLRMSFNSQNDEKQK